MLLLPVVKYFSKSLTRFLGLLFIAILPFVACSKKAVPAPPIDTIASSFVKGADVGWLTEMEAAGKKFYTASGQQTEAIALLKGLGINTIRLRVWVNPTDGWNGKADVLAKARRAKDAGMRLMIDFHYSDSWADPGKQTKPAAWANLNLAGLKDSLAAHTKEVLDLLKANSITPEWVQVGNETNDGMLWPEGRASTNMASFAQLINTGYDAVKSVFPSAKVIVHISNGWNRSLFQWMFNGLKTNGAKWDVIGMSMYPTATDWQTLNAQCSANMNDMVSRYGTEVMIVEVGMPWDGPEVSKSFISDLMTKVKAVPNEKGLGVLYWEPQAYGNWKGYSLGAFDNSGKPTTAMDSFK